MADIMTQAAANLHSREQIVHALYEAAELEHNLMCTYLYAAASLKSGEEEGLSAIEAEAVARWRRVILEVARDEMGHLTAVWNITSALGAAPRVGRANFPLEAGYLPAGVVVRLAPFSPAVLQHFIHLERPHQSDEPDGEGFAPERQFIRGAAVARLTPVSPDYQTVGDFYLMIESGLRDLTERLGESAVFCGDVSLQLSAADSQLANIESVACLKTALAALDAIVLQGEGSRAESDTSHFSKFLAIRDEYRRLLALNPAFAPAHPSAVNPVFRRPPRPEGRVWIEDVEAGAVVDLANAGYGLMLRLLALAYSLRGGDPAKTSMAGLAIGLMRALSPLAETAARLPAGPSHPDCNAGVSFVALRDTAPLQAGDSAWQFVVERFCELSEAAERLVSGGRPAVIQAARVLRDLAARAGKAATLAAVADAAARPIRAATGSGVAEMRASFEADGIESVEGDGLTLMFEAKRCIHARFCVTGAPTVFLANVKGPWLHPETMAADELAAIARECPSGAIQYRRKDGKPDEALPPVNLIAIREAGPYAVRADIRLDAEAIGFRATLCRCGASKNKPFCDGAHREAGFAATGEPATGAADMLTGRDGPLAIDPQLDGPLQVRGNLEITSGTGRVVSRVQSAMLCRCGGSANKPFCDGTHARIGFRST